MNIPKELNGYPVIMAREHKNCATVMVSRRTDVSDYVVATWWPELGSTWSWGHYDADSTVFANVCKRNELRG